MNILDETIPNPEYIPPGRITMAYNYLQDNEEQFCDLPVFVQRYFNYLVETERERCFYKDIASMTWCKCLCASYPNPSRLVVRIDENKPEPEYEYLPITSNSKGYYCANTDALEDCDIFRNVLIIHLMAHRLFAGFIDPDGNLITNCSEALDAGISDKWQVRLRKEVSNG